MFAKVLMKHFCQYFEKTVKFPAKIMVEGNAGAWTSRLHMTEPNKICRNARKMPVRATIS